MYVLVCTNLSSNAPHRKVGMIRVDKSQSLGGVMASTQEVCVRFQLKAQNFIFSSLLRHLYYTLCA